MSEVQGPFVCCFKEMFLFAMKCHWTITHKPRVKLSLLLSSGMGVEWLSNTDTSPVVNGPAERHAQSLTINSVSVAADSIPTKQRTGKINNGISI